MEVVIYPANLSIFSFSFNFNSVYSFTAVVAEGLLIYLLLNQKIVSQAHRWLAVAILAVVLWGFGEGLNKLSGNFVAASFWELLSWIGWVFAPSLFLAFSLAFVGLEQVLKNLPPRYSYLAHHLSLYF